jgi:hypothetical protein
MSVDRQENGALRLACNGDWCSRKFSPKRACADVASLRWRATMYGWLTSQPEAKQQPSIPGIDDGAAKLRDLCPECRRAAA